jgi:hypothetical protein
LRYDFLCRTDNQKDQKRRKGKGQVAMSKRPYKIYFVRETSKRRGEVGTAAATYKIAGLYNQQGHDRQGK